MSIAIPYLQTGNRTVDKAFRIAVGDFLGNIHPLRKGLLAGERPVIYAGIHYIEPWTRDAAFNVWNGASLIVPEIARDTLLSIIGTAPDGVRLAADGHHYWDAIIAVLGFWQHYLYTGDREFLALAYEVARRSMEFFESTEFDPEDGLFRGLACCMDAISAYPDELAYEILKRSDYGGARGCLRLFTEEQRARHGVGIPFKTLSTNALYYQAYRVLRAMEAELGQSPAAVWPARAEALKRAINRHFRIPEKETYYYLVGCPIGPGRCDHQEALGHAFVLLFDIAADEWKRPMLDRQVLTPAGVPYLWPTFPRYRKYGENEYGRASGTVWPHAQALWADAALRHGRPDLFRREFMLMAAHAERDSHFAEVLHPETGEIYGGVQEVNFTSKPRQTWCATGFIRLVLQGLLGMTFRPDGVRFHPWLPSEIDSLTLSNLRYRACRLRVRVSGPGGTVRRCAVNGREVTQARIPADSREDVDILIEME